jgi:type II secretory pathway pseudopilin PulG
MKKFRAFTLVETLIVIVVFCIWILVVLQWLSQTLRNKEYADIQIKSAFFAREWIELVFNLRDANYHKKLPWNCIFERNEHPGTIELDENNEEKNNPFCNWRFWDWSNNVLKIWMWSEGEYVYVITDWNLSDNFDERFDEYQIYFHTWNNGTWFVYNHDEIGGEKTRFARYLVIEWVDAGNGNVDPNKLLKIQSHVLYRKWYLTGEKVMETFIGNYEFKR